MGERALGDPKTATHLTTWEHVSAEETLSTSDLTLSLTLKNKNSVSLLTLRKYPNYQSLITTLRKLKKINWRGANYLPN